MVTTAAGLVATRQALVDLVAPAAAGLGATTVLYEGDVLPQPSALGTALRIMFELPRRRLVGQEGDPQIQQRGRIVLEWAFPRTTGSAAIQLALNGTAALLKEQVLPDGTYLSGDVGWNLGSDATRTIWTLSAEWENTRQEFSADENPFFGIATPADAILAVRSIWETRIANAVPAESWPGVPTYWDSLPNTQVPLPWAGYWISASAQAALEIKGPATLVIGRALVQMQTPPNGMVRTLEILERIFAEHNRHSKTVSIGPADPEAQFRGPTSAIQTNIRIPFRFERLRD